MLESNLMKLIQKRATEIGLRLFRNNSGRLQTKQGTYVNYGLCKGSSDLIGWKSRLIKLEDVGTRVAQFVAVEVKSPTGILTEEQAAFLDKVEADGGIALEARSVQDIEFI